MKNQWTVWDETLRFLSRSAPEQVRPGPYKAFYCLGFGYVEYIQQLFSFPSKKKSQLFSFCNENCGETKPHDQYLKMDGPVLLFKESFSVHHDLKLATGDGRKPHLRLSDWLVQRSISEAFGQATTEQGEAVSAPLFDTVRTNEFMMHASLISSLLDGLPNHLGKWEAGCHCRALLALLESWDAAQRGMPFQPWFTVRRHGKTAASIILYCTMQVSCAVVFESRHLRSGPYIGDLEMANVSTALNLENGIGNLSWHGHRIASGGRIFCDTVSVSTFIYLFLPSVLLKKFM